jgi:superfamily II DNA/RNA helicase
VAPPGADLRVGSIYDCERCGRLRWCSSENDSRLSKIPRISDDGKLEEAGADDLEFFHSLQRPLRTRLRGLKVKGQKGQRDPAMLSFLDRPPRGPGNQLDALRELLGEFGLDLKRLYIDEQVNQDEPLLLCWKNWEPDRIEIDESNDPQPSREEGKGGWTSADKVALNVLEGILLGNFKDHQRNAIHDSMDNPGSLIIAALPTGFGKTRIGQVITWLNRREKRKGPTLLISPLIALIDDQRDQFDRFNEDLRKADEAPLRTHFLTAADETSDTNIMTALLNDEVDVLCCSPETLLSPVRGSHWVEVFLRMSNPFSLMVVDEAHTIADWGASIRPEFQLLGWVKDRLLEREPRLRVLLMSATITKHEEIELTSLFRRGLKTQDPIREDRLREDISFNVVIDGKHEEEVARRWMEFLRDERGRIPPQWFEKQADRSDKAGGPPLLVYTPLERVAIGTMKNLAQEVICNGDKRLVKTYTGGTPADQRDILRRKFLDDQIRVMVATSAFGMGIDKEDVWTIAHLGMPFTLKGLYQGFGRAARKSNWPRRAGWKPEEESEWRSGNCLGVIPDTHPRSFNRHLGIKKTMERVWDMFYLSEDSTILENGYVVVPVISLDEDTRAYWSPCNVDIVPAQDDEEEDAHDDWTIHQELAKWAEEDGRERNRIFGVLKRRKALFGYNMWTIACLQRTGKVEFLGLHHPVIRKNRVDGREKKLVEILRESGYPGVIKAISEPSPRWQVPRGQTRLAVLRFKTSLTGHADLEKLVLDGHEYLYDRHSKGREELKEFIRKVNDPESCIRAAFAPAIGLSKATTCAELSTKGLLQMPCNHCRERLGFPSLEQGGFIWSSPNDIATMRGRPNKPKKLRLSNASFREMSDLTQGRIAGKGVDALIVRLGEDLEVPCLITGGELKSSEYTLYAIDGSHIRKLKRASDGRIESFQIEWPRLSTGVLFWKGQARIVTDVVMDTDD